MKCDLSIFEKNEIAKIFESDHESIFHYSSTRALLSIIQSNSLRFTNSYYLNDKHESYNYYRTVTDMILSDERYHNNDLYSLLYQVYTGQMQFHERSKDDHIAGLSCFSFSSSLNPNSIPMWNYYAQSDGICIEFDLKKLESDINNVIRDSETESSFYSYKSIYDTNEKHAIIEKCINVFFENENDYKNVINKYLNAVGKYRYSFKDRDFNYEHEYRFQITLGDILSSKCFETGSETINIGENINFGFYEVNGVIKPALTIKLKNRLPIKKILLSPLNNSESLIKGIKLLLHLNGYSTVEVEKAQSSIRKD